MYPRIPPPRSGTKKQARQYDALSAAEGYEGAEAEAPWSWAIAHAAVVLDGAGDGQVVLPPAASPGAEWRIERVRVFIDGGRAANPGAIATLYLNNPQLPSALDASQNAGEDTGEYPNPIILNSTDSMVVAWVGGNPGATARATIQGLTRRTA